MRNIETCWIGLGGNLGPVRDNLHRALDQINQHPKLEVVSVSSLYETPPWGNEDQPPFLNACAELGSRLEPTDLLDFVLQCEHDLGRKREEKWGPRNIDIDLLAIENRKISTDRLKIPHPFMLERAFVLVPLVEIAPNLEILGTSIKEAIAKLDGSSVKRVGTFGRFG